jgi:hypothetical protein
VSQVNIVKRIKLDGLWKMVSIPRDAKGNYDWNAIADGYYVEWYVGGTRRSEGAGVTGKKSAIVCQRANLLCHPCWKPSAGADDCSQLRR